mmetsp:Transcript_18361/g.42878  ORF Transcript_18361/g.42878 Transcript_18361/m.42878 type:complete len:320 (-) Transcript_18361:115-1074(-)
MVWVPQLASNAGSMKPVGKRPVQTVQDPVKAVEMQFTKVFRGAKGETYTMDKKDQHSWHCHRQQHGQIKTFTLRYDKESSCVWWGNWTYCADPADFTKFPDRMFWYPCADDRHAKSKFVWEVAATTASEAAEQAVNPNATHASSPNALDRPAWRPRMRELGAVEPRISKLVLEDDVPRKIASGGRQAAQVKEVEELAARPTTVEKEEEEAPVDLPPGLETWIKHKSVPVVAEVMNASSNCEKQFANHKLDTHTLAKDLDAECEGKYEADTCADSNGEPHLTDSDSDLGCKDQGEHDRDEVDLAIRFEEWRQFWRVALRT